MKKIYSLVAMFVITSFAFAAPITSGFAKIVAENYFKRYVGAPTITSALAYTGTTSKGQPSFYVFDINGSQGFVIVSADDAAHPIIGYSNEGKFELPSLPSNIENWLQKRSKEIDEIRTKNLLADQEINTEWSEYSNNNSSAHKNAAVTVVTPLLTTKWNQSPYYNSLCPGGSVTGCVATTMSQIMRYWSYPTKGLGSSSYNSNYGMLTVNYSAATYLWATMPNQISSNNSEVAEINYHCGVSVEMDYSPSGSGAWVISADAPVCAQNSYVQYFNYEPSTIQGLIKTNYTDVAWVQLLKTELEVPRPIQYVGSGPDGGHTWVCDGYDATSKFHMNWGWGGSSNGYFALTALNPSGSDFNSGQQALIGIRPKIVYPNDAGIQSVTSPNGFTCSNTVNPVIRITNFGTVTLTSCVVNYNVDGGTTSTQNWNGSLASGASATVALSTMNLTAGTHNINCFTTNPNGTSDGNLTNDQSTVTFNINSAPLALPFSEGFESSANVPTTWTVYNPNNDAKWQVINTTSHTGANCIAFNNCNGNANSDMTGKRDRFYTNTYDFSAIANPFLSFDVAYTPCISQGTTYGDTLMVYYSTNCGSTWTQMYSKGGVTLATAPTYTLDSLSTCWTPASGEWRTDNVNASALVGQSSVMFAFENRSGWGQWIFLDNININGNITTGVKALTKEEGFLVYPNPAVSELVIEGNSYNGKLQYSLMDISGRELKSGNMSENNNVVKETISVENLAKGIYFLQIKDDTNKWVKKITVQ